jgi:Bacteriophage related domain of unknown function
MPVEVDIPDALKAWLLAMPDVWAVAWPNVDFTPPTSKQYLRVSYQPNDPITRGIDKGGYVFRGLLLVTVVGKLGVGELAATTQAALIARRFDHLTFIPSSSGYILVDKMPSIRGGLKTDTGYEIPVVIPYTITAD